MKSLSLVCRWFPVGLLCICIVAFPLYAAKKLPRKSKVFGPPGNTRINPYLFNGFSRKHLHKKRGTTPYGYSILSSGTTGIDTIKIIALRVEFQNDSSYLTTGNGLFGIIRNGKGTKEDIAELNYYTNGSYTYDIGKHDSLYFAQHLEYVKNYYRKVSNSRLHIDYTIYPPGPDEWDAYQVPEKMTKYSPGAKKKKESWDEYYYRRTVGLMQFVRDAIQVADTALQSPFDSLERDPDGILYLKENDGTRHKAVILIFHAGASYLTDGGWDGYFGQDTPSDMIDAFISSEFFDYFANVDSIPGIDQDSLGNAGIWVNKAGTNRFLLDELMMVSETSNQDSLNWGINGILVNQIARQIGIPDLFSTMSGISGIGAFCIMDFAGYSAGRGFIPPWPSAWVRAFMGWDKPIVTEAGNTEITSRLRAISAAQPGDTTILLVPINNHEFYLIENRQRNLSGNPALFNYDTLKNVDNIDDGEIIINPWDQVNLSENVSTFDTKYNVIDSAQNADISIPASGICIWHVDEYIIRDHLEQNVVNADSSYRGISLEEADGVVDLGVMFQDVFYQAAFDYGGAADVFPHYTSESSTPVSKMGPFTRPSTQSNDGGHTYLTLAVQPQNSNAPREKSIIEGELVYNYADSVFYITVGQDTSSLSSFSNWPQRIIPDKFFEPVLGNIYSNGDSLACVIIDTTGRVYAWTAHGGNNLYSGVKEVVPTLSYTNDTIYTDSVSYVTRIPQPAAMPSSIGTGVYLPSKNGNIFILRSIDSLTTVWDTIILPAAPSSYVCNYHETKWAVGCTNGTVVFGDDASKEINVVNTESSAPVQAIAVINAENGMIAGVNQSGDVIVLSDEDTRGSYKLGSQEIVTLYSPFTLATADLDQDGRVDIIVCDRKQGVWLLTFDETNEELAFSQEWIGWPNDWAGSYRLDTTRAAIPDNGSAPAIADLDNDNVLDIIIGGTNGIYAYNHRGILLSEWPALLDTRYWYQRGSVTSSPVIAHEPEGVDPLIVFSAPTGENVTFAVAHIDSSNNSTGSIYYTKSDGKQDSISGLSTSLIDSLLVFGDSLILPYVLPGGFIDAFNSHGKRPSAINTLPNVGKEIQSHWPFTVGGSIRTSPLLCDIDRNNKTDILAVSEGGMVYRWELSEKTLPPVFVWPQAGSNNGRTFTYSGPLSPVAYDKKSAIKHFYNYPNPAKWNDRSIPFATSFKYQLTKPARSVRLDIFTYTGHHIVSESHLPAGFGWNEYTISLKKFGSAVYRCRLEVDFPEEKKPKVKYWKMAVIK